MYYTISNNIYKDYFVFQSFSLLQRLNSQQVLAITRKMVDHY